jgi:autophagy-related protein 5
LYDLHYKQDNLGPWRIVVHFQGYPTNKIIKCSTRESAEKFYSHSLKQALFVVEGSTRAFNNLAVEQQEHLWEGCNSGSRGIYEQVARSLRPTAEAIRSIPVRVLFRDKPTAQRPASLVTEVDGSSSRIEGFQDSDDSSGSSSSSRRCPTLLRHVVGPILSSFQTKIKDDSSTLATTELPSLQGMEPCANNVNNTDTIVLIHGIEVPLHAPIYDLWVTFAHADLFLYIVVRPRI